MGKIHAPTCEGAAGKEEGSVGVVGAISDEVEEGDGEDSRSNSFAPRVPEGGEESASAVRCGRA